MGDTTEATVYIKGRYFDITAYVKDGASDDAVVEFPSQEIEEAIRSEARCYLRVEITLKGEWLREHKVGDLDSEASDALRDLQLDKPEAWRTRPGFDPYGIEVELIRKTLRLDSDLRTRLPKESDMAKLNETDRKILQWHLDGNDARKHDLILAKRSRLAQQQYFWAVKERILHLTRIDLSVAWNKQSSCVSRRLADLIAYSGPYQPPAHLADHLFSPTSVPRLADRLKSLIAAAMAGNNAEVASPASQTSEILADRSKAPARTAKGSAGTPRRGSNDESSHSGFGQSRLSPEAQANLRNYLPDEEIRRLDPSYEGRPSPSRERAKPAHSFRSIADVIVPESALDAERSQPPDGFDLR